jgi:Ca-activated chloride channel family protein
VRVHTVGIDRAVNAGFLHRLATAGGGRAELVESEDHLDEVMEHIHHRIAAPLVTGLSLSADGLDLVPDTVTPARLGAFFPGVPLVVRGRWRGTPRGALALRGTRPDGTAWERRTTATVSANPAATSIWARAHLRELEDRYVTTGAADLERRIVDTSLRFGVLCRFTAFVAVDNRIAASGELPHQVTQPVEFPDGWAAPQPGPMFLAAGLPAAPPGFAADTARPAQAPRRGSLAMPEAALPRPARRRPQPADAWGEARRRLEEELTALRAAASQSEDDRRRLLIEFRDRLNALLAGLRTAGIDDARFKELSDLLDRLTAWLGSGDPVADVWDRTIRTLAAATAAERPAFWKRRPRPA